MNGKFSSSLKSLEETLWSRRVYWVLEAPNCPVPGPGARKSFAETTVGPVLKGQWTF